MADLTGYTALTEAHGDFSAAAIISRYTEIVKDVLAKGVKFHQQVGDEIFMISSSPNSLLDYAIKLRDEIEKESNFPSIHSGLHYGEVIKQQERFFGSAINLTSRIASYAQGGQILCSGAFRELIERSEIYFLPLGEKKFKNVTIPVEIFEIMKKDELEKTLYIDPVCRMQVSENTAPAKLPFEKKILYFCSFDCVKKFILHPELYLESDHG